ncbi:MAG TPA: dTDP-4-dehydrorhamnose 3,5-epimerase, partial [Candidatus Caenarcaniphilales bacterium]
MKVVETLLPDVLLLEPRVFEDERGFFFESFHEHRYAEAGVNKRFVQDNHSYSCKGTLRGLHYQQLHPQGKLVRVTSGEVFDVAVDIRRGSPTFGKWLGVYLSAANKKQLYIPEGFAHGFCVVSEVAEFLYKCTDFYVPGDERGIIWNDPAIGIEWPLVEPLLSHKDAALPQLSE